MRHSFHRALVLPALVLGACADAGSPSGSTVERRTPRAEGGYASAAAAQACIAPPEANQPVSYASFSLAPFGFKAATPWMTVVHDQGQAAPSTVEIDYIRLIGRVGGVDQIISRNEYTDGRFGGQLAARTPWYGPPIQAMPGTISNGVLVIRPSDHPGQVWHPYLELYPRADISNASSVRIEVRYRITGPARVQSGLDYWQYEDGRTDHPDPTRRRNAEAAVTDWDCTRDVWRTVGLERSTELPVPISVTTVPAGQAIRVGVPLRGTFTLRNNDDDPIGFEAVGIETRRVVNGDKYCDPAVSQHLNAFGWITSGPVMAPGATLTHTSDWTPAAAGTYCLTVVEKRQGTPPNLYQRAYYWQRQYRFTVAP